MPIQENDCMSEAIAATCLHCRGTFTLHAGSGKGRFCSRTCWRAYEASQSLRMPCRACGKDFVVQPWQLAKGAGIFCSRRCAFANRPARPPADRFWEKVAKGEGDACWLWMGSRDKNGYGRISTKRGQNPVLVTRFSWELHNGPIGPGLGVLHRCDNPPCVRPDHLFLGDQKANMRDCSEKDRTTRGERQPTSILTAPQVLEIRRRFDGKRGAMVRLGREFGVSWQNIADIVHRRTWAWLEG